MDSVTMRAQLLVLRLKIKAAVEIERRAIFVKLRANSCMVEENEIDLLGARQQGALNGSGRDASRALLFDPLDFREQRARLDRDAQDHLILHDQPSDRLAHRRGLRGEEAEQKR